MSNLLTLYSTYTITNIILYQQIKDLYTWNVLPHPRNCPFVQFIDAQAGILLASDRSRVELSRGSSFLWDELSRTRHRLSVHDASYSSLRIRMKRLFIHVYETFVFDRKERSD